MNTRCLTTKQVLVLLALTILGTCRAVDPARLITNVTKRHPQLLRSIYSILKTAHRHGYVRCARYQWTITNMGAQALDQQLREFELLGKTGRKVLHMRRAA